jgi:hypothetical protein
MLAFGLTLGDPDKDIKEERKTSTQESVEHGANIIQTDEPALLLAG